MLPCRDRAMDMLLHLEPTVTANHLAYTDWITVIKASAWIGVIFADNNLLFEECRMLAASVIDES